MTESPAQRALTASTVSLAVALACLVMFLPPWVDQTLSSVLRTVLTALVLALSVLLHWVFLGIVARRMERSTGGWVGLSVLLFPIGSAAALILLSWLAHDTVAAPPAPAPRGG
jgi:hypothetical protein